MSRAGGSLVSTGRYWYIDHKASQREEIFGKLRIVGSFIELIASPTKRIDQWIEKSSNTMSIGQSDPVRNPRISARTAT